MVRWLIYALAVESNARERLCYVLLMQFTHLHKQRACERPTAWYTNYTPLTLRWTQKTYQTELTASSSTDWTVYVHTVRSITRIWLGFGYETPAVRRTQPQTSSPHPVPHQFFNLFEATRQRPLSMTIFPTSYVIHPISSTTCLIHSGLYVTLHVLPSIFLSVFARISPSP